MNNTHRQVRLTIPNDLSYLTHVLASVRITAEMAGFKTHDITRIEMGVEEACANVIQHAFTPGEDASFEVIIRREVLGIRVIIREQGLPFDVSQLPEYNREDAAAQYESKGLGLFLMKSMLDEVSYHNLGKEGREVHLFKYRSDKPIDALMEEAELEKAKVAMEEETLPKGSVTYTVRRMFPEEAVEVSRGAYCSYGYTYVLDHIYFPDRVRELNERNELISYVAVTDSNIVIGHTALEVEERDPLVPQLGVAFTMPKYRGQGCLNQLTPALIEDGRQRGFTALYARGITTHPYSQKSILKFGFSEVAILLSCGVEREYKGIIEGKSQRESVAVLFRYLQFPRQLILHVPERHREMVRFIYEKLGVSPEFPEPVARDLQGETVVSMQPEMVNKVAKLTIERYGADCTVQIKTNLQRLCLERFETIYLYLPMKDSATASCCGEFEKLGFYFSGVMPGSENRDCLILQYQNNYVVDLSKVMLAEQTGQAILDYIRTVMP